MDPAVARSTASAGMPFVVRTPSYFTNPSRRQSKQPARTNASASANSLAGEAKGATFAAGTAHPPRQRATPTASNRLVGTTHFSAACRQTLLDCEQIFSTIESAVLNTCRALKGHLIRYAVFDAFVSRRSRKQPRPVRSARRGTHLAPRDGTSSPETITPNRRPFTPFRRQRLLQPAAPGPSLARKPDGSS